MMSTLSTRSEFSVAASEVPKKAAGVLLLDHDVLGIRREFFRELAKRRTFREHLERRDFAVEEASVKAARPVHHLCEDHRKACSP